ncbi:hypothetical protein ABFA07_014686 [Porites harrisoni]
MKSELHLCLVFSVFLTTLPQLDGTAIANSKQERKKVLILGAGAAGITAAMTLYDQGITDFLVLEAQDYIGGRIKSVPFAGKNIEEGANWIHFLEEKENPLLPLRDKYNLTGYLSNFSDFCMRNDSGQDVTDLRTYSEWKKVSEKLFAMGKKRGEEDHPPRDMPVSVALKLLGWISDTPAKKTLSWFDLDFEYGDGEKGTSLNNMGFPPEKDFFVTDQRGYWTLFSDFYKSFQDKILLNKVVQKIRYSNDSVTVVTAGGEVFSADYALSTFSSGVLGSSFIMFRPPLPKWKREAIYRFRPVYFTKIFLKFPYDFWDDHEWIMHASQKPGNFPTFYDLNRPGFFPGSNLLFTVVTGDEALGIEKQSDLKTKKDVMDALRKMYGNTIPEATDIHVSKWSQNPFVRCAWTDPVVGTSWGHYENMSGRLKNLFFAGESISDEYYGYVQGALFTGRDKAVEIANCIKGGACKAYKPAKEEI